MHDEYCHHKKLVRIEAKELVVYTKTDGSSPDRAIYGTTVSGKNYKNFKQLDFEQYVAANPYRIGGFFQDLSDLNRREFEEKHGFICPDNGTVLVRLTPKSPLEISGFKKCDRVGLVDGKKIKNEPHLRKLVWSSKGKELEITVTRRFLRFLPFQKK